MSTRASSLRITVVALLVASGCGSLHQQASFDPRFAPAPGLRVAVGETRDETGASHDVDIAALLAEALRESLEARALHWAGAPGGHVELRSRIVDYDRGNAWKRYMMPGWGSTELTVESDVIDAASGEKVGTVEVRRTVSIGGAFTIGAWKTIFRPVARDLTGQVAKKLGHRQPGPAPGGPKPPGGVRR